MERRCIGFEIDPESAETAQNRLAGWKPPEKQLQLFEVEEGDLSYSGMRLQCL
jgi:DNA modification methylase